MLVTFWEENSASVFEIGFLRKIFGLKRVEVKGDGRKLHKGEPHDFQVYISHQTMLGRSNRRGCGVQYVGSTGNEKNGYTVLVGKLEGTRSLGVPWRKWQSYIKLCLEYMGSDGVDWIYRVQDRKKLAGPVNTIM
jgi:hypothetical protein